MRIKLNTIPRVLSLAAVVLIASLVALVVALSSQDDTVRLRYIGYFLRDAGTSSYVTTWREAGGDQDVELPRDQVSSLHPQMGCLYEFNLDAAGKIIVNDGAAQGRVIPDGTDINGYDCL